MPLARCASCAAAINVKEELIGRKVKCPKCGEVFISKAEGAGETSAATTDPAISASSPDTRATGNPFSFDEPESPPAGRNRPHGIHQHDQSETAPDGEDSPFENDWGESDHARDRGDANATSNLSELRNTWRIIPPTILIMAISAAVVSLCLFATAVSAIVALLFSGPVNFGARVLPMPLRIYSLVGLGAAALTLLAAIAHFVGQITCCWTPRPYNRGAVTFLVLSSTTVLSALVIVAVAALSSGGNAYGTGRTAGILFALIILPQVVAMIVSWFNYLRLAALKFRAHGTRPLFLCLMAAMPASAALNLLTAWSRRPTGFTTQWDVPIPPTFFGFIDGILWAGYALALFRLSRQMTRAFAGEFDEDEA